MTDKDKTVVNSILDSLVKLERWNCINAACKLVLRRAEYAHDQTVKAELFETYKALELLHDPS